MKDVAPFTPWEDYTEKYSLLANDADGKTILEFGAAYGDTAYLFLKFGASKIISVEGSKTMYDQLVINIDGDERVTPINMVIDSSEQISTLITTYRPDIVHMNFEGGERFLLDVPNGVVTIAKAYNVEVHWSEELVSALLGKFVKADYLIFCIKNYRAVNVSPYLWEYKKPLPVVGKADIWLIYTRKNMEVNL